MKKKIGMEERGMGLSITQTLWEFGGNWNETVRSERYETKDFVPTSNETRLLKFFHYYCYFEFVFIEFPQC